MGSSYEAWPLDLGDGPILTAGALWLTAADELRERLARGRRRRGGAVLRRRCGVADPGRRSELRRPRDGHDPPGVRAARRGAAAARAARRLRPAGHVLRPRADRRALSGGG